MKEECGKREKREYKGSGKTNPRHASDRQLMKLSCSGVMWSHSSLHGIVNLKVLFLT